MTQREVSREIKEAASQAADRNGCELVHVEFAGTKRSPLLRVYVDKPNGVTLDDCANVSRDLEVILDAADLVAGKYVLEVSSPGLERELYSLSDFAKFIGHKAKVKIKNESESSKTLTGDILSVSGSVIEFRDRNLGEIKFNYNDVVKANLKYDLKDELSNGRR
ncbi:MAG TPA: ribosome maturation factor RimP [Pyrinomonadaceae bacterium]|jgi:ribosome maturation factor RimP|nr:ribosome maturation factor RimP [Pyrinomonadaceae bacterium]